MDNNDSSDAPPPPPPPHGADPKTTSGGLPPGPYDIFIIPPHSSGSGFLYLPSLKTQTNSFIAGYASALLTCGACAIFYSKALAIYDSLSSNGLAVLLAIAAGLGGWLFGRSQVGDIWASNTHNSDRNTAGKKDKPGASAPPPTSTPHSKSDEPRKTAGATPRHPRQSSNRGYQGSRGDPSQDQTSSSIPPNHSANGFEPHVPYKNQSREHIPTPAPAPTPCKTRPETPSQTQPGDEPPAQKSSYRTWTYPKPQGPMFEDKSSKHSDPGPSKPDVFERPSGPAHNTSGKAPSQPLPYPSAPTSKYDPRPLPDEGLTPGQPLSATDTSWSSGPNPASKFTMPFTTSFTPTQPSPASARPSSSCKPVHNLDTKQKLPGEKSSSTASNAAPRAKTDEPTQTKASPTKESAEEAEKRATAKARWEEAKNATKMKREAERVSQELKKKREENESKLKEMRARDAKERADREAKEAANVKTKSTYAFSATGEKTDPWPHGRPSTPPPQPRASPFKSPPAPRAETYQGTDEDAYSYRPYDQPPIHKKGPASDYSESSYTSQSTSKTSPPPSQQGPYTTKDPDKVVLRAVYLFDKTSGKTPMAQLISGMNKMSDGMVLRIDTAGLWIDDDVRNEGQRDWDIKAWTLGSLEVWCPACIALPRSARPSHRQDPVSQLFNREKRIKEEVVKQNILCEHLLKSCRSHCSLNPAASKSTPSASSTPGSNRLSQQTGKHHKSGYHLLRASVRGTEGEKFVFVMSETEAWKVMVGIGKLRKGSQIRSLQVSCMSADDAKSTLENVGWV